MYFCTVFLRLNTVNRKPLASQSSMAMEAAQRIATISKRKRKRKHELGHEGCRHLLAMLWDGGDMANTPSVLFQRDSQDVGRSRTESTRESLGEHSFRRALQGSQLPTQQPAHQPAQHDAQQLALL